MRIGTKQALAAALSLSITAILISLDPTRRANLATVEQTQSISAVSDDPRLIYSQDANDPWNQIFRLLFTRTVTTRLSPAFPEGAPFRPVRDSIRAIKASTRTFERLEIGDRAIDPLYPSFLNSEGVLSVVTDPRFTELKAALTAALAENATRSITSRALMQSDLWAAHDMIFAVSRFSGPDRGLLAQRREELLKLLSRLIVRKVALKPDEIQQLPDTFSEAASPLKLPDLFVPNGEWIEVQMSPHRLHDDSCDYRRAARVFFKPADPARNRKSVLEELRNGEIFPVLDAVALVVQNMIVSSNGTVVPSRLAIDVQVRKFIKDAAGKVIATELHQYELSRRALLSKTTAGLIEIDNDHDLYLPASGNDYQFASPLFSSHGNDFPLLVSLEQRCEGCHGKAATAVFTLSTHDTLPMPPILSLSPLDNVHGWYVAGRKQEREDFKTMLTRWR